MILNTLRERFIGILDLGGPVVVLLLALSVLAFAVILLKLLQFGMAGVGRHGKVREALANLDDGQDTAALSTLRHSRSHLAPILQRAIEAKNEAEQSRVEAEAASNLDKLERSFRILDSIAQIAPLLGLFGTVLGMISAFQTMQEAGTSVDPSTLAGGIWVALLTTAVGLAVSMPTSLFLTFLESRVARERSLAEIAIETLFHPLPEHRSTQRASLSATAHAG